MFVPETATSMTDSVSERDGDWEFSDSEIQGMVDSAIRLVPLDTRRAPLGMGWPLLDWDTDDNLPDLPGSIDGRWEADAVGFGTGTPVRFPSEERTGFLSVETAEGETFLLRQRTSGPAGKKAWAQDVSNNGWTLELRLQVVEDETVEDEQGHFVSFDDGVHREKIYLHADRLILDEADLTILFDLSSRPRSIRVGAEGENLHLLLDDGRGFDLTGYFTGESVETELAFGTTGDSNQHVIWDAIRQHHGDAALDDAPTVLRRFSTIDGVATSPSCKPKQIVRAWQMAIVKSSGSLAGGTTSVTTQYRNLAGEWVALGTTVISAIGNNEIDLDSIPVLGNGSDEIRFLVTQVSATGDAEPAAVESITVLAQYEHGALSFYPKWGPSSGGQTILLDLAHNAILAARKPLLENTADAEPGDTFDGRRALIPCDGTMNDVLGGIAVETGTVAYRAGLYAQAAMLGSFTAEPMPFENALDSFEDNEQYGRVGEGVEPVNLEVSGEGLALLETTITPKGTNTDPFGSAVAAQYARTEQTGQGFEIDAVVHTGEVNGVVNAALGFAMQIHEGSVRVEHGGEVHVFHHEDYLDPRWVTISADPGSSSRLKFTSESGPASWRVGHLHGFTYESGYGEVAIGHEVGVDGFGVEAYVTPYHFADTAFVLGTIFGNDGWDISLQPGGFPSATIGNGVSTDTVTGQWPLVQGRRYHLALNFRRYSDHNRLQILVDGQVCGEKITTLDDISEGDSLLIGSEIVMQIEEIAVQAQAYDAHALSVRRGFTAPLFQVGTDIPQADANKLILRFDETSGQVRDHSGNANHPYQPVDGRLGFMRNAVLDGRTKATFWKNGALNVLHNSNFLSNTQAVYIRGRFWKYSSTTQTLWAKWNSDETVGWMVQVLENGTVKVTVRTLSDTHELTSTYALADEKIRTLYAEVGPTGIVIRIDGTEDVLSEAIASILAATEDAEIGRGSYCQLSDFVFRNEALDSDTYAAWRDTTLVKQTSITDRIYVDQVLVADANVVHTSPFRKYFRLPAHPAGQVTIHAVVDAASPGMGIAATRPFLYTHHYRRVLTNEDLDLAGFKNLSPFRIMAQVPGDGIPLSYIQAPDAAVDRMISLVGLEHETAANLATYFGGEFPAVGPTEAGPIATYAGQADTKDVLVSNRSVKIASKREPYPLYYKFLLGSKRWYLTNPSALTAADIDVIRASLALIDEKGEPVPFADYPWDIEVSQVDAQGQPLPSNVFSVMLLTRNLYIPGKTVRMRYNAADSLHGWRKTASFIEVINPKPIFQRIFEGTPARDQFRLDFREDGTYDVILPVGGD